MNMEVEGEKCLQCWQLCLRVSVILFLVTSWERKKVRGGKLSTAYLINPPVLQPKHIYTWHTFKIDTNLHLTHIYTWHTFTRDTHLHLTHIYTWHTFTLDTHLQRIDFDSAALPADKIGAWLISWQCIVVNLLGVRHRMYFPGKEVNRVPKITTARKRSAAL